MFIIRFVCFLVLYVLLSILCIVSPPVYTVVTSFLSAHKSTDHSHLVETQLHLLYHPMQHSILYVTKTTAHPNQKTISLLREIIAVCCKHRTKNIKTRYGQCMDSES